MSKHKATIHRLMTGVPGLDELLGGGVSEFSFNIIAGSPGSGKTTLAHQIMFTQATAERPALFFTVLGEPPLKMLRYQQQFDFFDIEKVNQSIHFINLSDDTTIRRPATWARCSRGSLRRLRRTARAWSLSIPSARWRWPVTTTAAATGLLACRSSSSGSAC